MYGNFLLIIAGYLEWKFEIIILNIICIFIQNNKSNLKTLKDHYILTFNNSLLQNFNAKSIGVSYIISYWIYKEEILKLFIKQNLQPKKSESWC